MPWALMFKRPFQFPQLLLSSCTLQFLLKVNLISLFVVLSILQSTLNQYLRQALNRVLFWKLQTLLTSGPSMSILAKMPLSPDSSARLRRSVQLPKSELCLNPLSVNYSYRYSKSVAFVSMNMVVYQAADVCRVKWRNLWFSRSKVFKDLSLRIKKCGTHRKRTWAARVWQMHGWCFIYCNSLRFLEHKV